MTRRLRRAIVIVATAAAMPLGIATAGPAGADPPRCLTVGLDLEPITGIALHPSVRHCDI
jgi:hypothetical protein